MRFRRRQSVSDVDAARTAAAGVGAYAPSAETAFDASHYEILFKDGYPYAIVNSPDVAVTDSGPQRCPFPSECLECGGHVAWYDRGNHWDGRCWGECGKGQARFKPLDRSRQSITREYVEQLERDNRVLRSERDQAIAQRDIARAQRDEARAAAASGRMSP